MATWEEVRRKGIAAAHMQLDARSDLPELLRGVGVWWDGLSAAGRQDRASMATHPATHGLTVVFEDADLPDVASYLRTFAVMEGPIPPGVWPFAQLLGQAVAHRYVARLPEQADDSFRLFGLESYGAFEAFSTEVRAILTRDPVAWATAVAKIDGQLAGIRDDPGRAAIFGREREGVEQTVRAYQETPTINEAWETRLDSHAGFNPTLLLLALRHEPAELLRRIAILPHPALVDNAIPDAAELGEDELLHLIRQAPAAFDANEVFQAVGMVVVCLLGRAGAKIRYAAWGRDVTLPVYQHTADLAPVSVETQRVIALLLDTLFARSDAVPLAWAWLERLIYEGERRGLWSCQRRQGSGLILNPLIILVAALAGRLAPRVDFDRWTRERHLLWRVDRAMAGIAVEAFAAQVDRAGLRDQLGWTVSELAPAHAGIADGVARTDGIIGLIGSHALLVLEQPESELLGLWQQTRPVRERRWRTSVTEEDHNDVAQLLILWGLGALEAAPNEVRQGLWSGFDTLIADAALTERVRFHGEFWPNMLQRFGACVARLLTDVPDPIGRLADTLRCHVRPDRDFMQLILSIIRGGVDQKTAEAAVAKSNARLSCLIDSFLADGRLAQSSNYINQIWLDEIRKLHDEMLSGHQLAAQE